MSDSADPTIIRLSDDEILVAHQRAADLNGIYRRPEIAAHHTDIAQTALAAHEGWRTHPGGWGCPCGYTIEGPADRPGALNDVRRHKAEAIVSALQAAKGETE